MITLKRFRAIEAAVRAAGYGAAIEWSEHVVAPRSADDFAAEAIYVICNSGMKASIAGPIHRRCLESLRKGETSKAVFNHVGKTTAIDAIWNERVDLFAAFQAAADKLAFCATLPFIGPTTSHHLAKNYGVDTAKADVHLERLARHENRSVQCMCRRLSRETGYRVATVDTILWRACAEGIIASRTYEQHGWRAGFMGVPSKAVINADEISKGCRGSNKP